MLLNVCRDIGLAVNIGKTKDKEVGRHRGMVANEHIVIKSENFIYLDSLVRNQEFY